MLLGSASVPVAATDRNGYDESVHHGIGVVVDADGTVVATVGDPATPVYARSAMKPVQAEAMLAHGLADLDLPPELLAVVCASHDGSPAHVAAVRCLLATVGLDETALRITPTLPDARGAAEDVLRAGGGPAAITMNCSGKHAGMLATCVTASWPTDDYLSADHPLQARLTASIAELVGPVAHVGTDGCGAPAHVVMLAELARAVGRIANVRGPVQAAMATAPDMVAGPTRAATRIMRALPGVLAKDGAEGMFVIAVPDVGAVAVKIADGADRAAGTVAIALAATLDGVDSDALLDVAAATAVPVLGHGLPIGRVRSLVGAIRDTGT